MTTFDQFARKIDTVNKDLLSEQGRRRISKRVAGLAAAKDVPAAVTGDLGDRSMSGWRRGRPIDVAKAMVEEAGSSGAVVRPVRQARGPMRVLESGRNQGNAFGFAGPGVNRDTGETGRTKSGAVRKQRARKARRWNGYTTGKSTWSDAAEIIDRKTPERVHDETVRVLRKVF